MAVGPARCWLAPQNYVRLPVRYRAAVFSADNIVRSFLHLIF
jgi:hypothetical protein